MKIRSTELDHVFIQLVYKELNAYCAQGLTLDAKRNFSAVVQAIEYDDNEVPNIVNDLGEEEILANLLLASELNIPFYVVIYKNKRYWVYTVYEEKVNQSIGHAKVKMCKYFEKDYDFAKWWADIKQTSQPHPMNNGAQKRADQTIFDYVLEKHGLEWGGNIDGFQIKENKISCIFDDISIGFTELDNEKADPSLFFHKRGPVYNTWFSTVKLANQLKVPHILFTKNKNNPNDDRVGLSVIKKLSKDGIYYYGDVKPCKHIVKGLENIKTEVKLIVDASKSPTIE